MILAMDTSTQWMGLALADEQQVLYEKIWKTRRRHTVELTPAIQQALAECGSLPSQLSSIAVARGPGSFTSLRIGLAVAKGLALSLSVPVIGIPTLDITAACQPQNDLPMIAVLKAGRERLACCRYEWTPQGWFAQGEIFSASAQQLEESIASPTLICGEIDAQDRKTLERRWRNVHVADAVDNIRRPSRLALLAVGKLEANQSDDVVSLAPIYLHTLNMPAESG